MNKSGSNCRVVDLEYRENLRLLITAMGGVPVVAALEVPCAYSTTQGISARRDVDYFDADHQIAEDQPEYSLTVSWTVSTDLTPSDNHSGKDAKILWLTKECSHVADIDGVGG
jgi:hypothetical protein